MACILYINVWTKGRVKEREIESMTVEIFIRPECSDRNYACVSLCGQHWNVVVVVVALLARASCGRGRIPQQMPARGAFNLRIWLFKKCIKGACSSDSHLK